MGFNSGFKGLRRSVASLLMWQASCKQLLRYILSNKTESNDEKCEVSGFCYEVVEIFTPPGCCAIINKHPTPYNIPGKQMHPQ